MQKQTYFAPNQTPLVIIKTQISFDSEIKAEILCLQLPNIACLFFYDPIYSFDANYLFDLPKIINLPINFLHIYSSDFKVCKMSRAGVERAEKILVRMGIGYAELVKTLLYN